MAKRNCCSKHPSILFLALGMAGGCERAAPPSPAAHASAVVAASSSAPPSASAAPLPSATKASLDCPRNLYNKTNAQLETMVVAGDSCAMNELGPRLFKGRDAPPYRRGAELLKRAFQAGVAVSECNVFYDGVGMDPDFALGTACLLRTGFANELAVVLLQGDGTTRHLDQALSLVHKDPSSTFMQEIGKLIEQERKSPSAKHYSYCDGFASTTVEIGFCGLHKDRLTRWNSVQTQAPLVEKMVAPQRALYDHLVEAFEKYANDDVEQCGYAFANGSMRGVMAVARRVAIGAEFDLLFEQIVAKKQALSASPDDLAKARADLATEEQRISVSISGPKDRQYDPADHLKRWSTARASWIRYRDAWLKLGVALGGSDSATVRSQVEILVTRARIQTMHTGGVD